MTEEMEYQVTEALVQIVVYIQSAIDIYTTFEDLRVPYMGDEATEKFDCLAYDDLHK